MRWIVSVVCLVALAIAIALTDTITGHLPHTWWFVGPFVVVGLVVILLLGRINKRL